MKKNLTLLLLLLAISAIVHCSNDYNPFTNRANANIHILSASSSFSDGDSVYLYHTHTLALAPTVYELIDSFSLQAPGSRLVQDTTCRSPQAQNYYFKFSWYDTGRTTITLRTYRDKEELERTIAVYVRSPLNQPSLDTSLETTIQLRTSPVSDTAWYHWAFSTPRNDTLHNQLHRQDVLFNSPGAHRGALWVSTDSLGLLYPSPKVLFTIQLSDSIGPSIECLNAHSHDTIYTALNALGFEAEISDPADIGLAKIQNKDFEYKSAPYYKFTLRDLDTYDATNPLRVTVHARDNGGNLSQRIYYVVYDSTRSRTGATKISILDIQRNSLLDTQGDSVKTTLKQQILLGTVVDYTHTSVQMSAIINDTLADSSKTIPLQKTEGKWDMTILLSSEVTRVTLLAEDSAGMVLAEKNVTIIYDTTAIDSTPPALLQLAINGTILSTEQATNGKPIYISDSTAQLTFLAFDNSGIKSQTLNSTPIHPVPQSAYEYRLPISNIPSLTTMALQISLTDSSNNTTTTTLRLQQNDLPVITDFAKWNKSIIANNTTTISFTIQDKDAVTARLIRPPAFMSLQKTTESANPNSYQLTLTPQMSDTGGQSCTIELLDVGDPQYPTWSFHVLPDTSRLIKFATTADSIPLFIFTDTTTLIPLRVHDQRGTPPLSFKALLGDSVVAPDSTSNRNAALSLAPDSSLVGHHLFRAIACDGTGDCDTLEDSLWIVPKPKNDPTITAYTSSGKIATNSIIDINYLTQEDSLYLIIQDLDHPIVDSLILSITKDEVTTSQRVKSGDSVKVYVKPNITAGNYTIKASVVDAQGNDGSSTYLIRTTYNPPFELSVAPNSPMKPNADGFYDMSEATTAQQIEFTISNVDPSKKYLLTIARKNKSSTTTLNPNIPFFSITVDSTSNSLWDTVDVSVSEESVLVRTLQLIIYYGPYEQLYQLQLNTSTVGSLNDTLYGFPLLVRLDGSTSSAVTLPSASTHAVTFFKQDNTPLAHEQEFWDSSASGALGLFWVRLDTIIVGTPYQLRMGITKQPLVPNDAIKPFAQQDGFEGVWHMRSTASKAANSVSGTADSIVGANALMQPSLMGPALQFDGNSDYINTIHHST